MTLLRDILAKTETELRNRIAATQNELDALQAQLAEVLIARDAIEKTHKKTLGGTASSGSVAVTAPSPMLIGDSAHAELVQARIFPVIDTTGIAQAFEAFRNIGKGISALQFNGLTIKDLIIKALAEHYKEKGASASELVSFLGGAYGREVEKSSLSPQLSRLKEEGRVIQIDNSKWMIAPHYLKQLKEQAEKRRVAAQEVQAKIAEK